MGSAAALFFAAVILLYVVLRKPKALEPLNSYIPSINGKTRKAPTVEPTREKSASTAAPKYSKQWLFKVPQRNIIM